MAGADEQWHLRPQNPNNPIVFFGELSGVGHFAAYCKYHAGGAIGCRNVSWATFKVSTAPKPGQQSQQRQQTTADTL